MNKIGVVVLLSLVLISYEMFSVNEEYLKSISAKIRLCTLVVSVLSFKTVPVRYMVVFDVLALIFIIAGSSLLYVNGVIDLQNAIIEVIIFFFTTWLFTCMKFSREMQVENY